MLKPLTGTYTDAEKANLAVKELIDAQYHADEISVVVTDSSGRHEMPLEHDSGVAEGVTIGGALGATLGVIGATLVATGILAAPGLRVLATGPLLAALRGAFVGLGAGGLVGALAGLGFWKEEAHVHAEDLREGAVLVVVHTEGDRLEGAREIFRRTGATRITG